MATKVSKEQKDDARFSLNELISLDEFLGKQDALKAILTEGTTYTIQDAKDLLNAFYEGGI